MLGENRLKKLRKEKKLTQQQLAEGLGITRQYISLLEKGEAEPTVAVAMALANKLNQCVYDLFGNEKERCELCQQKR